jgi:hypothetical protein
MCTTDYIKERAHEIESSARGKIAIIDGLIADIMKAQTAATDLPRAGGLIALLLGMHAELAEEKATALRVIESAIDLRRKTQEV